MGRDELLAELLLERFGPVEDLQRELHPAPTSLAERRIYNARRGTAPGIEEIEERSA